MKVMVSFIPLPLFPRGSGFMLPIEWAPESVWTFGEVINFLILSGIEPRGIHLSTVKNVQFLLHRKTDNSVKRLST
jgi:hypothetical protein